MIKKSSTKEILEKNKARTIPKRFDQSCVVLHNIRSMHNVGSVFRTCDAFGIGSLILSGYTPTPPRPEISKAALGADKNINWKYFDTVTNVVKYLNSEPYFLIGIEQTNNSKSLESVLFPDNPVCFIFGNEVKGIDEEFLPHLHECVEIPQYGQKHSLNVSVSAGVVIFHYLSKLL